LATNEKVATLSAQHYKKGGCLSWPCRFITNHLSNGKKLPENKSVTGFTREKTLSRNAGRYNKVQPWQVLVIEDERVITGQNPSSAHAVGKAIVKYLN